MSILIHNDVGAIIDHQQYISAIYYDCLVRKHEHSNSQNYRLKQNFFEIHTQFMMDSQFQKVKTQIAKSQEEDILGNKSCDDLFSVKNRKRKKTQLNNGEKEAMMFHEKLLPLLQKALDQLLILAREKHYLPASTHPPEDNNTSARRAASCTEGPGESLVEMSRAACETGVCGNQAVCINSEDHDIPMLFNKLVHINLEHAEVRSFLDGKYLLPVKCSFLMSDISVLDPLLTSSQKYDLIVIDPPWYNKSVKRKSKYKMLYEDDILTIPLPKLAAENCLVIVWATNKQQQHDFIKNELFTKWRVKLLAQWYWLKITKHGQPITDLNDPQKKPYETVFLGHVTSTEDHMTSATDISNETKLPEILKIIPQDYVFISVPSSIHSHKPPLFELLKTFLPDDPSCLEMFARNLLPGWTSWGNEVLKLQHLDFYEVKTSDTQAI